MFFTVLLVSGLGACTDQITTQTLNEGGLSSQPRVNALPPIGTVELIGSTGITLDAFIVDEAEAPGSPPSTVLRSPAASSAALSAMLSNRVKLPELSAKASKRYPHLGLFVSLANVESEEEFLQLLRSLPVERVDRYVGEGANARRVREYRLQGRLVLRKHEALTPLNLGHSGDPERADSGTGNLWQLTFARPTASRLVPHPFPMGNRSVWQSRDVGSVGRVNADPARPWHVMNDSEALFSTAALVRVAAAVSEEDSILPYDEVPLGAPDAMSIEDLENYEILAAGLEAEAVEAEMMELNEQYEWEIWLNEHATPVSLQRFEPSARSFHVGRMDEDENCLLRGVKAAYGFYTAKMEARKLWRTGNFVFRRALATGATWTTVVANAHWYAAAGTVVFAAHAGYEAWQCRDQRRMEVSWLDPSMVAPLFVATSSVSETSHQVSCG